MIRSYNKIYNKKSFVRHSYMGTNRIFFFSYIYNPISLASLLLTGPTQLPPSPPQTHFFLSFSIANPSCTLCLTPSHLSFLTRKTLPVTHPHQTPPLPSTTFSAHHSLPPFGLCFTSSLLSPAACPPSRLLASLQKHLATLPPNIS